MLRDHYSLPVAGGTLWEEALARGNTPGQIQPQGYKVWPVLHVSCKQKNYMSVSTCWVTKLCKKKMELEMKSQ